MRRSNMVRSVCSLVPKAQAFNDYTLLPFYIYWSGSLTQKWGFSL